MNSTPTVRLAAGTDMPQLGFGVWQIKDPDAASLVGTALEAGYTSIDTAAIYGNERGVGDALKRTDIARERLFVTTKLWNDRQGYDETLRAFDESLGKLGLAYVDLYLIHWPVPSQDRYRDTWKAFERLFKEGRAKAIGVSNFQVSHLKRLLDGAEVLPALNQIELHPLLQQTEMRAFHAAHGIVTEAWSPLARGAVDMPAIVEIASKHARTPAQVILRWHMQLGNVAIPKSATPSRIRENIAIFDFTLDPDDMAAIAALDADKRTGPHPDHFGG